MARGQFLAVDRRVLQNSLAAQKAKARSRARSKARPAAPANDNVVPLEPLALTAAYVIHEDGEAPFAPPPADDILGVNECEDEEETIFVAEPPAATHAEAMEEESFADEAPFDPPELDDEPVFSAPASAQLAPVAAPRVDEPPPPKPLAPREEPPVRDRQLPAISVYASWDRPEVASLLSGLAADRRLARASLQLARGGIDGAAAHCAAHESPDLLILDTNLHRPQMLAALDRLSEVIGVGPKVVVIGAINDIGLLRDLAARGVSDYVVTPTHADDLARALCALFADADASHVVAVIGARGGVGASTIAHNLAWTIAERHQAGALLADLDLCFGGASLASQTLSIADVLSATDAADEALERAITKQTARFQILGAPVALECGVEFSVASFAETLARMRRASPYVVLNLPHVWEPWVKQALLEADDVIIAAAPDLASLRNADGILKLLRSERDRPRAPMVALSMVGVPKRPEIPFKDFAEALCVTPAVTFAFDPALYGQAAEDGRMIGEVAPQSKIAAAFDALATLVTGREPVAPAARVSATTAAPATAPLAPLDLVECAPAAKARTARGARRRDERAKRRAAPPPQRRRSTGLVRAAMAVLALGLSSALYVQQKRDTANAAEPQAAAPPPPAATAPPVATPQSRYQTALALINTDPERGAALLRRLADAGFVMAQYSLAKLYEHGDLTLAREWTERAAAGGNMRAMHDLGVYYARGEGGVGGDAGAFRWFRQAAEFGMADSQYNLGVLYEQGRGVSSDAAEALFWFMLAARGGDEGAAARVTALEAQLTQMQIEQAQSRARAFAARAANAEANGQF